MADDKDPAVQDNDNGLESRLSELEARNRELAGKVNEFRQNNIELRQKLESSGADADAQAKIEELENQLLEVQGKGAEAAQKRLEQLQNTLSSKSEEWNKEKTAAEQRIAELQSKLDRNALDRSFDEHLDKLKIKGNYRDFMRSELAKEFKLVDGEPAAVDSDGNLLYNTETGKPWTLESRAETLRDEFPDLFEGSRGGGAVGGGKTRGGLPVLTPEQMMRPTEDVAAIIASGKYIEGI